ncbi:hypothetical protein AVEN_30932-1 [Araneus ventricosus]|uniref:Uncharacterized protein n=1 Tax=Araneus ventricosus TaxID=182803 RepID=A0A4Y2RFH0_ARAVE|nr:hypothetical protein AVEN_30932-1 [Araneus ventricosus]
MTPIGDPIILTNHSRFPCALREGYSKGGILSFPWTAIYPHVLAVRGDPLDGWYILVPGVSIGWYPSHLAGLLKGIKRKDHSLGLGVKGGQRSWRNCEGDHPAFSKSCPRWILEKEIQATKIRKNISFAEARKLVTERTPKPGVVYSSAVKQNKPINQPTVTECAHCGYRANTENLRKTSLQPVASMKPIFSASSLQTPREPSTSLQTASIVSPLMVKSPPKQKQSLNAVKSKNITNVNRQEQIKETKAAKKARLTALKKKKNLRNNPTSKEDFLKNPEKETSDLKNVDPLLNIHPSDEDLMSSVSETDSPPPTPKSS